MCVANWRLGVTAVFSRMWMHLTISYRWMFERGTQHETFLLMIIIIWVNCMIRLQKNRSRSRMVWISGKPSTWPLSMYGIINACDVVVKQRLSLMRFNEWNAFLAAFHDFHFLVMLNRLKWQREWMETKTMKNLKYPHNSQTSNTVNLSDYKIPSKFSTTSTK